MSIRNIRDYLTPTIFGLLSVASPLANNIDGVRSRYAVRPVLMAVILPLILVLWFSSIFRSRAKGSLAATLFILLFSAYGHVVARISLSHGQLDGVVAHLVLGGLWALGFLTAFAAIGRWKPRNIHLPGAALFIAASVTVIPVYDVVQFEVSELRGPSEDVKHFTSRSLDLWNRSSALRSLGGLQPPDIVHIVVDGYAGEEVLLTHYQLDNRPFVTFLRNAGFFVADRAKSNYSLTHLSLASTLNTGYLTDLLSGITSERQGHQNVTWSLRQSSVRRMLGQLGYRFVAFPTEYRRTEIIDADYFIEYATWQVTPFEGLLIESSFLSAPLELLRGASSFSYYPGYAYHRGLIRHNIELLSEPPLSDGPDFVFAHLITPHPPFAFAADGTAAPPKYEFTLEDASGFPGNREEYLKGYRDQVLFINEQLMAVVRSLVIDSESPPIVIIQGDHGPGAFLDWDSPESSDLSERMSILNSVFLPSQFDYFQAYDELSPVNNYRVILNSVFQQSFQLLPDEACFSNWVEPFEFLPVEGSGRGKLDDSQCSTLPGNPLD